MAKTWSREIQNPQISSQIQSFSRAIIFIIIMGRPVHTYILTHNVCKTVCLSEELLVYAIQSGQSWQTMGTVLDDDRPHCGLE
jgi:hypothetical protein